MCMEQFEHRPKRQPTKEERSDKLEKSRLEGEQAMVERRKADEARLANLQRLRTERLARESK